MKLILFLFIVLKYSKEKQIKMRNRIFNMKGLRIKFNKINEYDIIFPRHCLPTHRHSPATAAISSKAPISEEFLYFPQAFSSSKLHKDQNRTDKTHELLCSSSTWQVRRINHKIYTALVFFFPLIYAPKDIWFCCREALCTPDSNSP